MSIVLSKKINGGRKTAAVLYYVLYYIIIYTAYAPWLLPVISNCTFVNSATMPLLANRQRYI